MPRIESPFVQRLPLKLCDKKPHATEVHQRGFPRRTKKRQALEIQLLTIIQVLRKRRGGDTPPTTSLDPRRILGQT